MALHESRAVSADAGPNAEAPQMYSFTTALFLKEELQINEDVVIRFDENKRHKRNGKSAKKRVLLITKSTSESISYARSAEEFPDLSAEPASVEEGFDNVARTIGVSRGNFAQIGRSYRINLHEVIIPEGRGLVLRVESLILLQPPQIRDAITGQRRV